MHIYSLGAPLDGLSKQNRDRHPSLSKSPFLCDRLKGEVLVEAPLVQDQQIFKR
jgi:hypothetical protein